MVKSTVSLLCKSTSSIKKRKIDETPEQYLRQITHLYLNGKQIDELGDEINLCKNLNVLYLYDNRIKRVPKLFDLGQLTHLYLQNNQLSRIENLSRLENLEKLFLGRNSISVVEGLDGLTHLQELRIDNQRLFPGESLIFDEKTLETLGKTLSRLDVSGNQLESLIDLKYLSALTYLCASENRLTDLEDLVGTLKGMPNLRELDMRSNPVMSRSRVRDVIIVSAKSLEILDNKEITSLTRKFLENWNLHKGFHPDGKDLDTAYHTPMLDKVSSAEITQCDRSTLGQGETVLPLVTIESSKSTRSIPGDIVTKSNEGSQCDLITSSDRI